MITRIILATIIVFLVTPFAFGQMKYSRSRSQQSPTPTPTPLQVIPPKEAVVRSQPQPQSQRMTPTPTPTRQTFGQAQSAMQKPTPVPSPARQAYLQPQKPTQKTAATLPSTQQTFRQAQVPPQAMTPAPIPAKPTPVPPPDIQAYLDRQLASSKDRRFHLNANGKDLPLTPFHVWRQKEIAPNTTSTCVDMKSDEGRVYDIDFVTTGKDVTGIKVHRINGETVR
jgi:hypothetical protein